MKLRLPLLLLCITAFLAGHQSWAQLTTSSVSGKISDSRGDALPGATFLLVYKPTNSSYGVATNADGRFVLANLNPGGPYDVTVSFVGYQTEKKTDLYLRLGESLRLNFQLKDEAQQLSEVVVVGVASDATT